jgi:hypothetical protein
MNAFARPCSFRALRGHGRPHNRQAGCLERVDDPEGQGKLRTDHGQADAVGAGDGEERFRLREVGRQVRSDLGSAGVARRAQDRGDAGVAGERPGQGMFTGPISKHENFH